MFAFLLTGLLSPFTSIHFLTQTEPGDVKTAGERLRMMKLLLETIPPFSKTLPPAYAHMSGDFAKRGNLENERGWKRAIWGNLQYL